MRYFYLRMMIALLAFFCTPACVTGPFAKTNRQHKKLVRQAIKALKRTPPHAESFTHWVGTTNFNLRRPNYVIIHHTAQLSCDQTLKTFTSLRTQVSAHYVICKDGRLFNMLNDHFRAWHGGISKWGNTTDLNSSSIGIELDNNGNEAFPDLQITTLLFLLDTLKKRHQIPAANFIGHADIAPTRKSDPNIFFPWQLLAQNGFGLWWDDTTGVIVPPAFNSRLALRAIGYDLRDSSAAIRAFKRHFVRDTMPGLNESDLKILYKLYLKYD